MPVYLGACQASAVELFMGVFGCWGLAAVFLLAGGGGGGGGGGLDTRLSSFTNSSGNSYIPCL